MLDALISSKTRIKLLLKFFLNPRSSAYLRGLESEFGESSNAIRLELNRFESAGLLNSFSNGNKRMFKANPKHPLFMELRNIVLKHLGVDRIIEEVVSRLGDVNRVYLTGDLALGKDTGIIDLVLVGDVNREYLGNLVTKAEALLDRKIRYLVYNLEEASEITNNTDKYLLIWNE